MYEIRNKYDVAVIASDGKKIRDGLLSIAKARAEAFHNEDGQHYGVFKVEQVWTTQTINEAMKE